MSEISEAPAVQLFYKYTTPNTALAILRSKTFRYSSPLLFNDPFDFQSGLHLDFDIATLPSKIFNRLEKIASAQNEPKVDAGDPWGQLAKIVWLNYRDYGFPRTKFEQLAGPLLLQLAEEIQATQQKYQEHWLTKFLPGLRVFCVSEDRDNLLMWAHYAKDHTGAVFELRSLPEEDNPLSVAQPVEYSVKPPPFFTENEWLDEIFSIKRADHRELNRRYAYAKSAKWDYEREWRVWYPVIPAPEVLWVDNPIRINEVSALYIGCRADPSFASDVVELMRQTFPSARLYRAIKVEGAYTLKYSEI